MNKAVKYFITVKLILELFRVLKPADVATKVFSFKKKEPVNEFVF